MLRPRKLRAAGDHAEFRHAHEARHRGREEGHRGGDRPGEDSRPHSAARLHERLRAVHALAPLLEVAADVVRAVVDPDADHRDGEGHAQDVEVADARRRPGERPGHADRQHAVGQQGVADAAEPGDDHEHDRRHREAARPDHRGLAGPHLVVLHHRDTGEPDRDAGMPVADAGHDPPQLVGGRRGAGEAPLLLGEPQEHEAEPAVLGEQVLAREVAER